MNTKTNTPKNCIICGTELKIADIEKGRHCCSNTCTQKRTRFLELLEIHGRGEPELLKKMESEPLENFNWPKTNKEFRDGKATRFFPILREHEGAEGPHEAWIAEAIESLRREAPRGLEMRYQRLTEESDAIHIKNCRNLAARYIANGSPVPGWIKEELKKIENKN